MASDSISPDSQGPDPQSARGASDDASGHGGRTPSTVTITKKDLVNRIAERTGETKVITKSIIQMFLDEIISELSHGNRLEFRDFGVFEVKPRRARRAQNPRTLEKVNVPPKRVVKFKVGRVMRECVTAAPDLDDDELDETPGTDAPGGNAPRG